MTAKAKTKTRKKQHGQKQPKRARGRPTAYSPKTVEAFLEVIAKAGTTADAAAAIGVATGTVFVWLAKYPDFQEAYTRAKEAAADFMVDEMLAIIDDGRNDFVEGKNGPIYNPEAVARSRLRFEGRKWLAAKLRPKKYADKIDIDHGVQEGNPLASLVKAVQGTSIRPVGSQKPEDER